MPPASSGLVEGTAEYNAHMIEKLDALKESLAFCHADKVSPDIVFYNALR